MDVNLHVRMYLKLKKKNVFFFSRLKAQIPDIKTSLDIVKHLQSRKVSFIVLVPLMLDDYM